MTVVKGDFNKQGLSAADRRAIALHEWNVSRGGASTSELHAEIQRLRKMIPDDSADEAVLASVLSVNEQTPPAPEGAK